MNGIAISASWSIWTRLIAWHFTVSDILLLVCWVLQKSWAVIKGWHFSGWMVWFVSLFLFFFVRVEIIITICRNCSMWSDMLDFTHSLWKNNFAFIKNMFVWDILVILATIFLITSPNDLFHFWGDSVYFELHVDDGNSLEILFKKA